MTSEKRNTRYIRNTRSMRYLCGVVCLILTAGVCRAGDDFGRWRLVPAQVTGTTLNALEGGRNGTIHGSTAYTSAPEAMIFDGIANNVEIPGVQPADLPPQDLTLEAWVSVSSAVSWAGAVNYIQDNGSSEHGWILGQLGGSFLFGLSTSQLTYLSAAAAFQTNRWYYLVGTYDGAQMRLYVNGQLSASSSAQSGPIDYLPSTFMIGAYKDDNEEYKWKGAIHEVAVLGQVLSASEVQQRFDARKAEFAYEDLAEVAAGPYAVFSDEDYAATVYWETKEDSKSILEYGIQSVAEHRVEDAALKTTHTITLQGLKGDTVYKYRMRITGVPAEKSTEEFALDTTYDWGVGAFPNSPSPYPADGLTALYETAAQEILSKTGITQGVCLVLGSGEGRLACEIAKRSRLKVIGIEESAAKVAAARQALDEAGIYGEMATIQQGSLSTLPYVSNLANLIVSDLLTTSSTLPGSAQEMWRVLRPYGGTFCLGYPAGAPAPVSRAALENWLSTATTGYTVTESGGALWALQTKPAPPGAGEWTHQYANPANTSCSEDQSISDQLQLAWYGRPGPHHILDRHNRPMAPLFRNGRLVIPGNDRILAVDAYNGTRLWDVAIPGGRRVGVLRDTGWVALAGDSVYATVGPRCVRLDAQTGVPRKTLHMPEFTPGETREWGYLAAESGRLYGSGQREGASRRNHGYAVIMEACYGDNCPLVCSEYLFCLNPSTSAEIWRYKNPGGGLIPNAAIAISADCVFLIESRNADALADTSGRMPGATLLQSGVYLVKLDKRTGAKAWEQPVTLPFAHTAYLSCANGVVLAVGSRNVSNYVQYELCAFDASDGSSKWTNNYIGSYTLNGDHGEQDHHPVIAGNQIYSFPYAFDLLSGARDTTFSWSRGGHACATFSGSAEYLFGRGTNGRIYSKESASAGGTVLSWTNRPGCFINIVPAGGLVLMPESSAGCTCDFPLQQSLVFAPRQ